MGEFNPQEYWESRLNKHFNLNGVGDIGLGANYNKALYNVRRYAFKRIVSSLKVDFSTSSILDVGSGTGFYIERWNELGVKSISGSDITEVVVNNLSKKYNYANFRQLDIGEELKDPIGKFDFISAFDVLFHIVDDSRFERAITNIASSLNEQGYFIISDNFVRRGEIRVRHQVSRSEDYMSKVIGEKGFKLVKTIPMFILMNTPIDSENRILWKFNQIREALIHKGEFYGSIFGNVLKPIEKTLISLMNESPSTEIRLYRKE